jgi:hypothetical protein
MVSMGVHLDRPLHSVRLVAWGRADDGWWACVTWRQRVRDHGETAEIGFAAWVPAGAISRPGWSTPIELPRLMLPAERQAWPAPPGWPAWYAGVWPAGPVNTPAGVELITGPAWRERRRRG